MPLSQPVRYRYKKGTKIRLAITKGGTVIEAKNMTTGKTHSEAEFRRDRKKGRLKHAITRRK